MEDKDLQKVIQELTLKVQLLEQRLTSLEQGNFGTGIYLDGCTEQDQEYISGGKFKKAGE